MPRHYVIHFDEERLPFALALVESLLAHASDEIVCHALCADDTSRRTVERMRVPQLVVAANGGPVAGDDALHLQPKSYFFASPEHGAGAASAVWMRRLDELSRCAIGVTAAGDVTADGERIVACDFSGVILLGSELVVPEIDGTRRFSEALLRRLMVPYVDALTRAAAWLHSVHGRSIGASPAGFLTPEVTFLASRALLNDLSGRKLPHRAISIDGVWTAFATAQLLEVSPSEQLVLASAKTPPLRPPVPAPSQPPSAKRRPRVSALVSTYASRRYIAGCLQDLVGQTLFAQGELEIVVIDSASPEDEASVVHDFIARYGNNIRYERSQQREGVYMAWNRAANLARGVYLTNANTDDRHRPDALEILADTLDAHAEIALVYADSYVTKDDNAPFASATAALRFAWPTWSRDAALHGSFVGPHPMWRKDVHHEVGWFDGRYRVAGDYEMWLRITERFEAMHVDELLGMYLYAEGSVEHQNHELCVAETMAARALYAKRAGVTVTPGKYPASYLAAVTSPLAATEKRGPSSRVFAVESAAVDEARIEPANQHSAEVRALLDGTPKIFSVETVLACDLRCPECAIGGDRIDGRKRTVHSLETFKVIADKIEPFADYVYLHVWGEPLLNKDIFDIIGYASRFARTNISTNGNSLTEEKAERLVASGVSDIIVSIDGVSQEVYEKYRVGGDVRAAMKSLMYLQRARLRQGRRVNLMPQFIVFEHNEHEMEEFARLCSSIGLEPSFKSAYIALDDSRYRPSTSPRFRNPRYATVQAQQQAMSACRDPRDVFTILSDGSVVVCCHDSNATTTFGNIFHEGVMDIWNSPRYRRMRGDILSGSAPAFCVDNCLSYQRDGQGAAASLIAPNRLLRQSTKLEVSP